MSGFLLTLLAVPIGGLLNLVCDRLPDKQAGRLLDRPRCGRCGCVLGVRNWLALVGWLLARSRCQSCHARLPLRRTLVELSCVILFAYLWWRHVAATIFLVLAVHGCFLIMFLVIDMEHRLVPDRLLGAGAICTLFFGLLGIRIGLGSTLLGGLTGLAIFYGLALLGRGAMGGGDVKLAGLVGLMNGFPSVLQALVIGVLLGGIAAALLMAARLRSRKSYIPYAPFLTLGAMIGLLP